MTTVSIDGIGGRAATGAGSPCVTAGGGEVVSQTVTLTAATRAAAEPNAHHHVAARPPAAAADEAIARSRRTSAMTRACNSSDAAGVTAFPASRNRCPNASSVRFIAHLLRDRATPPPVDRRGGAIVAVIDLRR